METTVARGGKVCMGGRWFEPDTVVMKYFGLEQSLRWLDGD